MVKKLTKNKDNREVAISVENIRKSFKVPHEKHNSLKSSALNAFRKKSYEKFEALNGVSFEVKKGEFFGIIGRNGSGKSTLLKILAGIYVPDSGEIKINGKLSPFLELGVGFNPELTGRENLYLGGAILGLSRKEVDEKFDQIVKFAELEEFIDMKFKNYSSGMAVRLAFSLSINVSAEILLMDEVLAVGDSNFQGKCISEFKKYRSQGKTVVLVSHDTETIQRYCDRAMLLRGGKIFAIGDPEIVVSEYIEENIKDEKLTDNQAMLPTQASTRKEDFEVTNIEIRNLSGDLVSSIKTHQGLEIVIFFDQKNSKAHNLNVGISLENEAGGYLFGYSTEWDNYSFNSSYNSISITFKSLPLLKDTYFINVTFIDMDNSKTLKYIHRATKFKVYSVASDYRYKGSLAIDHTWRGN